MGTVLIGSYSKSVILYKVFIVQHPDAPPTALDWSINKRWNACQGLPLKETMLASRLPHRLIHYFNCSITFFFNPQKITVINIWINHVKNMLENLIRLLIFQELLHCEVQSGTLNHGYNTCGKTSLCLQLIIRGSYFLLFEYTHKKKAL